jgi:glyoxylase-like metal-dependent hydrolase (beta-lactamase superfamily II)
MVSEPDVLPSTGRGSIRTVAPGVHHIDTYPFNWYVLEEAGRLTLIDSGWPGHLAALESGLRALGKTVNDIDAILLTHAHSDHVGMAGALSRAHRIPVFVHPADRAMAASVLQLPWVGLLSNAWRPFTASSMLGHALARGLLAERAITTTYDLVDERVVDVPGHPRVVHVPGHTPGEVAFVVGDGVVLSGDTLVTEDLRTGVAGPPQFPHIAYNGRDAQARRSISKLHDLGSVTLLPGHGLPWSGPIDEAIELALAH